MSSEGIQVQSEEGQITREFSRAEEVSGRLIANIDVLENRLAEVIHHPGPPELDNKEKEDETLVVFASRIRSHYRLLQQQAIRLADLLAGKP